LARLKEISKMELQRDDLLMKLVCESRPEMLTLSISGMTHTGRGTRPAFAAQKCAYLTGTIRCSYGVSFHMT